MLVVTDASPIVLLGRIGQSRLLPALFGTVIVPNPVLEELSAKDDEVFPTSWMRVVEVDRQGSTFASLRRALGLGEASTLALGLASQAELVLMDDLAGRREAARLGLAVKGTLGILVAAKRHGLLATILPSVMALRNAGAWLSPSLIETVLAAAGEPTSAES